MSKLYAGIDRRSAPFHSNNNYLCIIDDQDHRIHEVKLKNRMNVVQHELAPFKEALEGLVVESTYNWYWLVDGLMTVGYKVHLANPAAIQQYSGLKVTDDKYDAFWLAHLLRLGILAEGYIYPKEERAVRDLLRKRGQMVRMQTMNILSIQNLYTRNTGQRISSNSIKQLESEEVEAWFPQSNVALAIQSNLAVIQTLRIQIKLLEKTILSKVKLREEFKHLRTIEGVGEILALTIMLETGNIARFPQVGNFTSYCRCVPSKKTSNGKKKGEGNRKNGNKYLAWAFVEAANFAICHNASAKRYYHRKKQKTKVVVAIKALAHKLARASYYIMRDQVEFDNKRLFGG